MDLNGINSASSLMRNIAEESRKEWKDEMRYQETTHLAREQANAASAQARALSQQVVLLKEQNAQLKDLYENAKKDSEDSKRNAKRSQIISWISISVSILINIVGFVFKIIS